MVKKIQKSAAKASAGSAALLDSQLAANVRDSAQQIWLAGMGAFSKAQAEGGKVFETLIKEGTNLQRKTQGLAEEKIQEVTGRMTSMAGDVQAKAGQHWDKLESIFEQRTAKALAKLGVPTAKDVDALIQRVDELAAAVARLSGQPARGGARKSAKAAEPAAPATPARARQRAAATPAEPVKAARKSARRS